MELKKISYLFILLVLAGCQSNNDSEKVSSKDYEINDNLPPSGEPEFEGTKEQRLNLLMAESKKTLDSIDFTYTFINRERTRQQLSLDEREEVNEALLELSEAKDLIVLQMQQAVIDSLKSKTESLENVTKQLGSMSQKLVHIAQSLSRVSGMIEKTTNLLAGALAVGIIRPSL